MESTRETVTPAAWNAIVKQRIRTMGPEWNGLPVQDRFWIVFNWLKEFTVADPARTTRQLFTPENYWQYGCDD